MASNSRFRYHLKKIGMVCVPRMTGEWVPPEIITNYDVDTGLITLFNTDPFAYDRYEVSSITITDLEPAITNGEGVEIEMTAHAAFYDLQGNFMNIDLILENDASGQVMELIADGTNPEPGDEELFAEEYTIVRNSTEIARFNAVDHPGDTHFDAIASIRDQWNAFAGSETDNITATVIAGGWNLRLEADNDDVPDFADEVVITIEDSFLSNFISVTRLTRIELIPFLYYTVGDPTSPGTRCDQAPAIRKVVIDEDTWNNTFVGANMTMKIISYKKPGSGCFISRDPPVLEQMWAQITIHYGTSVSPPQITLDKTPTFMAWRSVTAHLRQDNTYGYIWGETVWDPITGQFMIEVTSPHSGKKWYGGIGFSPTVSAEGELDLPWIGYYTVPERGAPGMMETYVRIERRPFLGHFISGGSCVDV